MPQLPNEPDRKTDRHRHRRPRWAVLALVLAAAVIVEVVVIDAAQAGFLVPIAAIAGIAVYAENRGIGCGRRHAK